MQDALACLGSLCLLVRDSSSYGWTFACYTTWTFACYTTNEHYILTARADMRGRLVQAALAGKLSVGQANLPGFAKSAPVDLTQLDNVIR